ncbi:MAG: NUDIX hydrolase [Candidatus Aureabacteria bacterium]|nr:NUDIX hydrolase [Candidatus Auribacterota bacterium]
MKEKTISKRIIYKGKILALEKALVKLVNGKKATREVIRHNGAVAVIAIEKPDKLILIRQFRYPVGKTLFEIPAGRIDKNEAPLDCIKREMKEETGYKLKNIIKLLDLYPCVGYSDELIHIYKAETGVKGKSKPEFDENIRISKVRLPKALEMVRKGKIKDSKTIIAILALKTLLKS